MAVEWKKEAAGERRGIRKHNKCKEKWGLEQKTLENRKEKLDEVNQGSDNITAWERKIEGERRECKRNMWKSSEVWNINIMVTGDQEQGNK